MFVDEGAVIWKTSFQQNAAAKKNNEFVSSQTVIYAPTGTKKYVWHTRHDKGLV